MQPHTRHERETDATKQRSNEPIDEGPKNSTSHLSLKSVFLFLMMMMLDACVSLQSIRDDDSIEREREISIMCEFVLDGIET